MNISEKQAHSYASSYPIPSDHWHLSMDTNYSLTATKSDSVHPTLEADHVTDAVVVKAKARVAPKPATSKTSKWGAFIHFI